MTYFRQHYSSVRLPIAEDSPVGLRRSQRGAAHAIAAHFTVKREPAVVSMPTGSGKTGVLMLSAFLERARRVLVVTPSKLIRNQVAGEFASLSLLKTVGALPDDIPGPKVIEAKQRLGTLADWEALRNADVVVATPNTASPAYADVASPPADLFDLLLVDEAHHAPATTWRGLLEAFPDSRRALFTATPFRQDRREIKGQLVYHYPLREAMKDGIYGSIRFVPVVPEPGLPSDVAIAKAAERIFRRDREAGLEHNLIVRTDGLTRAKYLADVYEAHTSLRLELVNSQHSFRRVLRGVERMRAGELDGIICVDMFGEGFDFPNLKVAAIHAPHKSLAVTVQFIGRFARTNAERIGEATFLAVPNEIEIERHRLYEEGAAWEELVVNLSEGRMAEEAEVRDTIGRFEAPTESADLSEEVSLYALRPYCHVKIYQVAAADVTRPVQFHAPIEVVHRQVSHDLDAAVIITRGVRPSRWSPQSDFAEVESDLYILYYDAETELLFINSSRSKNVSAYENIADQVCETGHRMVPVPMVDRVLAGIENPDFYNIGLKSRTLASSRESYRTMAGPSAQRALTRGDARGYFRGHIQGRGREEGHDVTIGYSSSSKVWSHRNIQISEFLKWCRHVARKIATENTVVHTGSALDLLSAGVVASGIPAEVLGVDWPKDVYEKVPAVLLGGRHVNLMDSTLHVDRSRTSENRVRILAEFPDAELVFDYGPSDAPMFKAVGGWEDEVRLVHGQEPVRLIDYINDEALYVYLRDGSQLHGRQLVPWNEDVAPFDVTNFHLHTWPEVDIENECQPARNGRPSVQMALEAELVASDASVVFFDHGSGEIADFIAVREQAGEVEVTVYHCKRSCEAQPGARVADIYDVCGQALKCTRWLNESRLLERVKARQRRSRFAKGDYATLEALLRGGETLPRYRVVIVQPGLSRSRLSSDVAAVLGGTDEALRRESLEPMWVVGSE